MNSLKAHLLSVFVLACLLAALPGSYAQAKGTIIYVKHDATGDDNGTSWDDAFTDLQSALAAPNVGTQIWVAQGRYTPTTGSDRTATFQLKTGSALYGGFRGNETMRDQRDPVANVTILSGDIGTLGVAGDNSYHVVSADNQVEYAELDGFTITGGNANGEYAHCTGGGLAFYAGDGHGSLELKNVIFDRNSAGNGGGGLYAQGDNLKLDHVTFVGNKSAIFGGGLYALRGDLTLNHVIFKNNTAKRYGGGIFNNGTMSISNSTFYANETNTINMGGGGGIYNYDNGRLIVSNSTFYGNNTAGSGGGIINSGETITVSNSTFSHNSARQEGGGIYVSEGNLDLKNSILANSTTGVDCYLASGTLSTDRNLIETSQACGLPLLTSDPKLGLLQHNGGYTPTMALLSGSPALDAGNDANCLDTDQRGIARPQGSHCDLGAYEAFVP